MKFLGQGFQKLEQQQDRHDQTHWQSRICRWKLGSLCAVVLLGKTISELLGMWRREAEKALSLRFSGDLEIDLYKVVAQREVS